MPSLQHHLAHPKYRPDIDGLRAIAVLSVVAFHAFPTWLKGGFIGVDIFFVISGYLISTIIFENLNRGFFSFSEFYARRIRRIFPVLLLVLCFSYVLGWFVLLEDEYKQLGKHLTSGATFSSNFTLWKESGYFDKSTETKPLLHLWSLAIEEQFYILWPLILWFAFRRKVNLITITILVIAVSFLLSIKGGGKDVAASFYAPQTRFWELLCGSLLAWRALKINVSFNEYASNALSNHHLATSVEASSSDRCTSANLLACLGLSMLVFGLTQISREFWFPGFLVLIPVFGTVLMIYAGPTAWINRRILSNRIAVWFGLISFPLYLWHWPLLSFTRIIASEVPSAEIRILAVGLSIFLAWLSHKLVERPLRFGNNGKLKVSILLLLMFSIGCVGYYTDRSDGVMFRHVVKNNISIKTGFDGGPGVELTPECGVNETISRQFPVCAKDKRGASRYALLGDSKAAAMFPGLVRTSTKDGRWLFIGGNGPNGAPLPVVSNAQIYKSQQQLSIAAIDAIANNREVEKVVFVVATRALFHLSNDSDIEDLSTSTYYQVALEGLKSAIGIFKNAGKKIVLVVDNPTLPHPEDCLFRKTEIDFINHLLVKENMKCSLPLVRHLALTEKYRTLLEEAKISYPDDVLIFDVTNYLCSTTNGTCGYQKGGRYLYGYTDHISDFASGLIGTSLNYFLANY